MHRWFSRTKQRRIVTSLVIMMAFVFLLPHAEVLAQAGETELTINQTQTETTATAIEESTAETKATINLPANDIKVRKTVTVTVTAYNAVPEQTDSTPCTTADGTNICTDEMPHVVAANWLPFGTKVRIPAYFGDTVFEVHDRMNQRYSDRLDVLLPTINEAKTFGVRQLEIEIL